MRLAIARICYFAAFGYWMITFGRLVSLVQRLVVSKCCRRLNYTYVEVDYWWRVGGSDKKRVLIAPHTSTQLHNKSISRVVPCKM